MPGFWDDPEAAQSTMQRLTALRARLAPWDSMDGRLADLRDYGDLLQAEGDSDGFAAEMERELRETTSIYDELELSTLLSGEHDASNALLELNAGAGGTEACDWVSLLLRMYLRWAERRGFACEIQDQVHGEVAGLKSVILNVRGPYAYGNLKGERGVHRLVRISPFDAAKRRHTSFASTGVLPEIEESEIDVNPDDLKMDTFRASSAGGQHMQKNETAVRITHLPSGIIVTCQNERSQAQNRAVALKVLRGKLYEIQEQQTLKRLNELRGESREIAWGSQIRSYVFQPYTMVKDHRTGVETGNIIAVMDGEIDPFLQGYLRWAKGGSPT